MHISPCISKYLIFASVALVGGGALAQANQPEPALWASLPYWRFEPQLEYSGLVEPMQAVIQDESEFNRLWKQIFPNHPHPPPTPMIDFSREAIVVFALGGRSSGGYRVRIDGVTYTKESLEVMVSTTSPGKNCIVPAVLTAPVDIIRIVSTRKKVNFRVRPHLMDCSTLGKP